MSRSKRERSERMLVMIESPYASMQDKDRSRNITYALRCMRDSLFRGEAPFAGHLLYTQVLDDNIQDDRAIGIECDLSWLKCAIRVVVYTDYGISKGMRKAINYAKLIHKVVLYRKIGKNV